jgi:transcriptional regulator with GAF, ATPase, and Fis domain
MRKLERHGPVHTASGGAEALAKLESGECQMLFLDRRLPDLDAGEVVVIIERRFPGIRVVLVDAETLAADKTLSGPLLETSFATLPLRPVDSRTEIKNAAGRANASQREAALPGMIGDSEPMRKVYRMARLVASRETTVLITGPTGSGKDVVARAIHQLSPRSGHGFAVLNCAAIPETLVESELFGYNRGAFTGAAQTYAGRILAAQGGTLFLDEIGELPLAAQSKLLRFLEYKEIQRLGASESTKADVRVIAATNRNLSAAVKNRSFREDLFFRLSAFPIRLAPLVERGGDILKLAAHFLRRLESKGQQLTLDREAAEKLEAHTWPGNVREMQQVLERAVILGEDAATGLGEHLQFSTDETAEKD